MLKSALIPTKNRIAHSLASGAVWFKKIAQREARRDSEDHVWSVRQG
jgi:hypothetical protein